MIGPDGPTLSPDPGRPNGRGDGKRRELLDRFAAMASDLVEPVTDADRRVWQRRAVELLADLLAEADRLGLPPLRWMVHPGLALIGSCDIDPDKGRAGFDAWADYLNAVRYPEIRNDFGDITRLWADVPRVLNTSVTIAIEADLFPTEPPTTTTTTTRDANRDEDSR
jgi:hypothetical protein